MKRILLFFCIFVSAAMAVEDAVDEIVTFLQIRKDVVHHCYNETEALLNDIMQLDRILIDDLEYNYDNTYERVGCFFACLMRTELLMINASLRTEVILRTILVDYDHSYHIYYKIITRCADRVQDIQNDPCEAAFYFIICVLKDKRANKVLDT